MARSLRTLRKSLVDERLAATMVRLLHDDSAAVQRAASAALCNLLLDESPLPSLLVDRGVIRRLVAALDSDVDGVPVLALCALKVCVCVCLCKKVVGTG